MARFVTSTQWRASRGGARRRAGRIEYRQGIVNLDKLAGGDSTKASHANQDKILVDVVCDAFRRRSVQQHTIEGLYAPRNRRELGPGPGEGHRLLGDIEARRHRRRGLRSDGPDPVDNAGIVADVLKIVGSL